MLKWNSLIWFICFILFHERIHHLRWLLGNPINHGVEAICITRSFICASVHDENDPSDIFEDFDTENGGLASSKHLQLSSWFSLRGSAKIKPTVRGFLWTEVPHGSPICWLLKQDSIYQFHSKRDVQSDSSFTTRFYFVLLLHITYRADSDIFP